MSVRLQPFLSLTLVLLTGGLSGLRSEEAARGRPTPIIFSAPKSDAVSSNLNQIGTRTSPLTDLESGLKKPFEIFDTGRSSGEFRPPNSFTPSAPVLNNRRLKDQLDKRAEDSYLLREDSEADSSKDDPLRSDDSSTASSGKSVKTALDRYYDNIERLRVGQTNRPARSLDLFAEQNKPGNLDDSKSRNSGGLFDKDAAPYARLSGRMTNSASTDSRLGTEMVKPRSFGDIFKLDPVEPARSIARTKETRLDEFKRLIDGPGFGARSEFNVAPPSSSLSSPYQLPKPVPGAPSSILSATPPPIGGSAAETPGFSGKIGQPVGLPDYAASSPSLTPIPSLQPPATTPPVPKFSIPRRRF